MKNISLEEYNIKLDSDITESLKILFEDIKNTEEEKILQLENGFYFLSKLDFNAFKIEFQEQKTYFASVLKDIKKLKIIGKEKTTIVISDYISYFSFFNCENIKFENLTFRTDSPNMHKLRVKKKYKKIVDFRLSNSSSFKPINNNIFCCGLNCSEPIISKKEDRKVFKFVNYRQTTLREQKDVFVKIDSLSETKKNTLRIIYKKKPHLNINDEIYIIDEKNINCGFYIYNSKNICFKNIKVNFSYSDLFKCIYSNNLIFEEIDIIPSKGVKVSILNDVFNFLCCSGDIIIEKCNLTGICSHCLKMFNPVYDAKLIDENTIRIKKDIDGYIYNTIKEGDEIVFTNLKLAKIEKPEITKIKKVFDNNDSIVLELAETKNNLGKKIALFNKSTQPKKIVFTLNKVDKVCKTMLIPQAEDIEIQSNELIDTDKNFIKITNDLYSSKEKRTAFISNKITISKNIFTHSTKQYITINTESKLPKKIPCFNKVIISKNIYYTHKRKLLEIGNTDSLVMLQNVFYNAKKINIKKRKK